ncbi:MAG: hypothetical protein AAGA30_14745, partial [Planctomycetota bacterium]
DLSLGSQFIADIGRHFIEFCADSSNEIYDHDGCLENIPFTIPTIPTNALIEFVSRISAPRSLCDVLEFCEPDTTIGKFYSLLELLLTDMNDMFQRPAFMFISHRYLDVVLTDLIKVNQALDYKLIPETSSLSFNVSQVIFGFPENLGDLYHGCGFFQLMARDEGVEFPFLDELPGCTFRGYFDYFELSENSGVKPKCLARNAH